MCDSSSEDEMAEVDLPAGQRDELTWLDPALTHAEALRLLERPFPAEAMEAYPVKSLVNSWANEGPELIEPAAASAAQETQIQLPFSS